MMNTNLKQIDLFSELAAIRDGGCIWCRLGFQHPIYSKCHANSMVAVHVVAHQAMDLSRTRIYNSYNLARS